MALGLVVVVFTVRYERAVAAPGIDLWRPLAVVNLLDHQWQGDVYSRSGRENIYQLTVLPQLQSPNLRSQERAAALRSSYFDVKFLGYQGVDVVQTPLLLAVLRPFTAITYDHANRAYLVASLLCFFGATYLLSRLLGFSIAVSFAISGGVALAFKAEQMELGVANVNNFQLCLIALFLWLQNAAQRWSDVVSGSVLALGIALKPNLAAVLPAVGIVWIGGWLWGKITRVAVGVLLGACVAFVTPALLVSSVTWSNWLQVLPELTSSAQPTEFGNIAMATFISSRSGIEASRPLLAAGALLVTAVALRPLWMREVRDEGRHSFGRTFLGVNAGLLLTLLTARLVWAHYLVLALPAILWVARNSIDRRGISGGIGALVIFLFTSFSIRLLTAITGTFFSTMVAWDVALLVLFTWVLLDLWNPNRAPPLKPLLRSERQSRTDAAVPSTKGQTKDNLLFPTGRSSAF
jgi:hypothetical protein